MSSALMYEGTVPGIRGTRVANAARRRRRRIGNLVFIMVTLAAVCFWVTELRPQRLGGMTDYVMVQGVSMEPTYRSGDLVVVKPALDYRIGDIVAYRVPAGDVGAGLTVIHRIVGGSAGDGFLTKGDNKAEVDDWHPKLWDIEGVPWAVLPRGGRILAFLHAPVPLGALAAAMAIMLFSYESEDRPRTARAPGSRRGRTRS